MYQRHAPARKAPNDAHSSITPSSSSIVFSRAQRLKRKSLSSSKRRYAPETAFKVIVVIEVIFLVCMWSLYSDRLRSSTSSLLVGQQTNHDRASKHLHRHASSQRKEFVEQDDGYSNKDDKRQSGDEKETAWERRLRQDAQQQRHREREKRKQQQEMRRALAKVGAIQAIPDKFKGPTLIIGGSDGSGTRAFAHAMLQLGGLMRMDDKESLDVHGSVMYQGQGWAPLVKSILNVTHSAN